VLPSRKGADPLDHVVITRRRSLCNACKERLRTRWNKLWLYRPCTASFEPKDLNLTPCLSHILLILM
jgi:hypothetical protein